MNKNIIKRSLLLIAVSLFGIACEVDYYNEHYLDGYENNKEITDVRNLEITLTADDYATIAKNNTNKALAEQNGEEAVAALAAISKNKYFATPDEAALYIPAFLDASYPTYDNSSSALVTYTTALNIPADVVAMNSAAEYTLTEADYQKIWGSETEFETALTPSTVSKLRNALTPVEGMKEGDYMVVTYNYSAEEPKADEPENPYPDQPAGNYTSVLGSAVLGDGVEVKGYISAVSSQGPILTDNGGSILLYKTTGLAIGDEVTVSGVISSYNCGFQIGTDGISVEVTGTTTVSYPTPMDLTGALLDELLTTRVKDEYAYYAKMTGTVAVSGNYYNFNVDGATTAVGSIYGATDELKTQLSDGLQCTLYGYFVSISKSGGAPKYVNMIVTSVEPTGAPKAKTLAVASEKQYAYFKYNGSSFTAADIVAIQPADYTAMGQTYGSFTNPKQDNYLPLFLAENYPYAQDKDKVYVGYRCYANSVTSCKVDEYVFNGEWTKVSYFEEKTDQFRKVEGVWNIDRTLELDYTGNGADTKAFYQYCVNWVYDFKDVPMGAPARDNAGVIVSTDIVLIDGAKPAGNYWVSNYGNNEFYTGASAYYGNMDWRPSACRTGFAAAGMGDLSDEEILAKLKEHTAEVFAAVLGYVYPDMTPEDYKKVIIKVYAYGPNLNYSFTFDVVEKGTFAYVTDSLTEL